MGGDQVVSIIDADMVIRPDFYLRMLPYLQTERDALVLAPQVRCSCSLCGNPKPSVLAPFLAHALRMQAAFAVACGLGWPGDVTLSGF